MKDTHRDTIEQAKRYIQIRQQAIDELELDALKKKSINQLRGEQEAKLAEIDQAFDNYAGDLLFIVKKRQKDIDDLEQGRLPRSFLRKLRGYEEKLNPEAIVIEEEEDKYKIEDTNIRLLIGNKKIEITKIPNADEIETRKENFASFLEDISKKRLK